MAEDSQQSLTDFSGSADADDGGAEGRDTEAEIAEAVAGDNGDSDGGATAVVDMSERRYPDADGTTTLAVTQVDYTVEGRGDDERPVLHVFGRDADRRSVHVRVHEFEPYFYAPLADFVTDEAAAEKAPAEWTTADIDPAKDPVQQHDRLSDRYLTDADGERFESIRGDRLLKITGQTPRDVGQLRDRFDHYEADILFPNRLLIDRDIRSGVRVPTRRDNEDGPIDVHHAELEPVAMDVAPRVCTFDIEVDDRRGFPEDGEEPIVCLTSHDSYDDEYIVWLYTAPDGIEGPADLPGYDPISGDLDADVRAFEREEALLSSFVDYIRATDPDVLTGWNFTDFDAPYLLDRIEAVATPENGLAIDPLSRVNEVWRSDWQGPNVKGRVVFDLLYAYKRTQFTELDSYRLDAVGETELDVGKERYPGDIGDLWEDDPERLLEYNLRDVELCVELDRKQEIVPFWQEVASFVGCKLEDATTPGDAVDMYILHEVHGDLVLPSKGTVDAEDYEGGAVFDPITGVKENVSVLDLKCFSEDTDVATPDGIRNIRELEEGDPVYTLNPETFECEVKPVVDTQSYDNQYGELHHASGNTYDFKVTENHRFLLSKTRGCGDLGPDKYDFMEYRDITETERFAFPNHEPMAGATRDRFDLVEEVTDGHAVVYAHDGLTAFRAAMPAGVESSLDWANGTSRLASTDEKTGKYLVPVDVYREHRGRIDDEADEVFLKHDRGHAETPTTFDMDDWLKLVGWFVTEGSFVRESPGIVLQQQDQDGRAAIDDLLDRMGLNYNVDEDQFIISNRFLHDWFIEQCGDGYAEKRLPEWVFKLDADHLQVLLDTLVAGDGSTAESGLRKFWSKSEQLKEDIARLAVRCGEKPTVSKQSDGTWYASIGKRGSMRTADATVEEHDGQVHCITAKDNHVVLAGRNGHFQWVGQSLYPMSMVTINASPETKVGDDYEAETYRAPNGTQFRAEPDGIIRTMVDDLLTEREDKKGLRNDHDPGSDEYEQYDRQQQAVKVIMNSLYGVLGWDRFRLYDKEMGAAVTATGRDVIRYTEEVVSKMDYQIVYGDSVTGERPIVVRDPDGNVRIRPIEALFDAADPAPGHETVITADGGEVASVSAGKEAGKLEGWEALSVADAETAEWRPIQRVIRHETDKPVTKLQHKFGESTTTSDHSYVTLGEDRELRETVPEEVDEPLRVPEFPPVSDIEQIDVYEVLDGYERVYEGGRGTGGTTTKTKRVHANESHVWFGHEHYDQLDSTVMVKRYIEPGTEDSAALLRLLAAYITEGSATTVETAESKFGASIAESRREWLEGLQTDYERLFENATVSVIASDTKDKRSTSYSTDSGTEQTTYNDRTQKLQMMNELSAVFFREFAGQTSRGKRLPSFVFNLSDEEQELFLDTLIEGDGSREFPRYTDEYAEQNFDFETTSRELAAGLSMLLTQRERKHSLKYRDAKDSYTIRTCESYRSGRDPVLTEVEHDGYVYDLSVTENDNFVDAVGGIVLHNTDSVMLELGPDVSAEAAIEQSFDIEDRVNESYDEFAREELDAEEHRFQIEFEKLYRRFFQAGKKKRYAGNIVWKEGKEVDDIDITGFEYKRSDIAPVTKRVQHRVIEMIVTGADLDDVRTYVHDEIESFKEGDADLDDIGIPGGIGQKLDSYDTATAQVRGAKYANLLLGTNFGRGSKPKRLYLENVDAAFFERMEAEEGLDPHADPLYGEFKRDPDVICFEYADQVPDEFHVDYEKMLEKTLKGPIARILEAMGVSWQEVESGQEQTGLGSFM